MASSTIEPPEVVLMPAPDPAPGTVVFLMDNGELEVPPIRSLSEFREWTRSDDFPDWGRIDYLAGEIAIDMSPQDLYSHGTVNGEIYSVLHWRVKRTDRGQIFVNQTRLSSEEAELSSAPDILFVSFESLESGRVKRIAKANDDRRFVELVGPADLVVETISDGSVHKDTVQLPVKYYRANVTEFWLVDARGDDLFFQLYRRGPTNFEPAPTDREGYQYSAVMDCWYRLERHRDRVGDWAYDLIEKPAKEDSP